MLDLGIFDDIVSVASFLVIFSIFIEHFHRFDLHHVSCLCLDIIANLSGCAAHVRKLFSVRRLFESVFRLIQDPNPEIRKVGQGGI